MFPAAVSVRSFAVTVPAALPILPPIAVILTFPAPASTFVTVISSLLATSIISLSLPVSTFTAFISPPVVIPEVILITPSSVVTFVRVISFSSSR